MSSAETSSSPPEEPSQYWCHHCEKRVRIESQPDVICTECKLEFVESVSAATAAAAATRSSLYPELTEESDLSSQLFRVLRFLLQPALPPPPPPPSPPPRNLADGSHSDESDFLPIEMNNEDDQDENNEDEDDEDDDDDGDDDDDDFRSVTIEGQSDEEEVIGYAMVRRNWRRYQIILRLREVARRTPYEGRHRILDWVENMMGTEDNSIEFRLGTRDRYIRNPRDYVDEAEYEALLQNLVDAEGKRGAPPAAKSAVEALKVQSVVDDSFVCAICMDGGVSGGDVVKEMPCGHGYHGDCIVPWLAARNTCPVCRFELPTDDADYEEERKKRFNGGSSSSSV